MKVERGLSDSELVAKYESGEIDMSKALKNTFIELKQINSMPDSQKKTKRQLLEDVTGVSLNDGKTRLPIKWDGFNISPYLSLLPKV